MDWGTERVCALTRGVIARLGLKAAELPELDDVDRPEDALRLRGDSRFSDLIPGKPPA
jgi:glycosyltransferase A (GT-A) superfamily protein (DUF2064 family)